MAQWHLTDYNATSERENLYMQSKGLDEVVRGLRSIVRYLDYAREEARKKVY